MKFLTFIALTFTAAMAYGINTSPENAAKIKTNSNLPIIYGVGAGGITLTTPYEESSSLLSEARDGITVSGEAYYEEGLYIRWRLDSPNTPGFILILSCYQGKLAIPNSTETWSLNQDISKTYAPNSKAAAEQFAKDYYRKFENSTEDCLATGNCELTWGDSTQKDFIVKWPGLTVLVSKDKMIIYRMLLVGPE